MKTWTIPAAAAQKFAANDYVSACYNIKCKADNSTEWPGTCFTTAVMDTNGNGTYEAGTDEVFYQSGGFYCCNQYHVVKVNGEVPNQHNAFLIDTEGNTVPVYLWVGDAIGENPDPSGAVLDFHCTNLDSAGAVVAASGTNFS